MSSPRGAGVVVGIDAGGTSTRARAVSEGLIVHHGTGGPGNPVTVDGQMLRASYAAALAGCPPPRRVVACVAGAGPGDMRDQIRDLISGLCPGARIEVLPDYAAAVAASPQGSDVTVIAGTGSVVCGRADGGYAVSGGRGWILGDHGSAARLGQAALERYCDDPDATGSELAAAVAAAVGSADWHQIITLVHATASPARLLAQAAPILTAAAAAGEPWAIACLDAEMSKLAVTTLTHIGRFLAGRDQVHVALSGGVWTSQQAVQSFAAALRALGPPATCVTRSGLSQLDGAVILAESLRP